MQTIFTGTVNDEYTVIWLDEVDSTSAVLERNNENLADLTVIAADFQTAGRGQADHKWHSSAGLNLTFSILVKYGAQRDLTPSAQQILTPAASLAVVDFLAERGIDAVIKKPNDIYVDGKKICGMLIENGIRNGAMARTVFGIGINVNQTEFPSDLPNPVSMSVLTGKKYDRMECLNSFLKHFSNRMSQIWQDAETLRREYELKVISLQK